MKLRYISTGTFSGFSRNEIKINLIFIEQTGNKYYSKFPLKLWYSSRRDMAFDRNAVPIIYLCMYINNFQEDNETTELTFCMAMLSLKASAVEDRIWNVFSADWDPNCRSTFEMFLLTCFTSINPFIIFPARTIIWYYRDNLEGKYNLVLI